MYCELGWLQDAVGGLRLRDQDEEENEEYETSLLQSLLHFILKATTSPGKTCDELMKVSCNDREDFN